MSIKLNIETGLETIELDEERKFKINVNDHGIIARAPMISELIDSKIKDYAESISKVIKNDVEDDKPISDEDYKLVYEKDKETKEYIFEKIDELFNAKISNIVFKNLSPISITSDGKFYVIEFLQTILPIIVERVNERAEKLSSNTDKYIAKYEEENK